MSNIYKILNTIQKLEAAVTETLTESVAEAKQAKEPFAVGMAAAKKQAGITKTPAHDLPKKVVKKGHEIGKAIKRDLEEASKPDFLDLDKDGDKKEPMKKAAKEKRKVKEDQDDLSDLAWLSGLKKKTVNEGDVVSFDRGRHNWEHYDSAADFFGMFEADHFDKEWRDPASGEFKGYMRNERGKLVQVAGFKHDNPGEDDDSPGTGWYDEDLFEDSKCPKCDCEECECDVMDEGIEESYKTNFYVGFNHKGEFRWTAVTADNKAEAIRKAKEQHPIIAKIPDQEIQVKKYTNKPNKTQSNSFYVGFGDRWVNINARDESDAIRKAKIYDIFANIPDNELIVEPSMDEGNAFTGKLAHTEKGGEFELDGKKYRDRSSIEEGVCTECGMTEEICECGTMEEGIHISDYGDDDYDNGLPSGWCTECGKKCEGVPVDNSFDYDYGSIRGRHDVHDLESDCCGADVVDSPADLPDRDEDDDKVYESCMSGVPVTPESESNLSVNTSYSTRDNHKTVTVTAEGEQAEALLQILNLAGLGHSDHAQKAQAVVVAQEAKEYGDTKVADAPKHANTPEPEVESVDAVTDQGADLNRKKSQHADKPKAGDNPLATKTDESVKPLDALGRRLLKMYEGIKAK